VDDIVTIEDNNNSLDLDDFTIEAWVYRDEPGKNHMIVSKSVAGEYQEVNSNYWLWIKANNKAEVGWELPDSRNFAVEGETPIEPRRWYHIAGVRSAAENTLRIFVNGVEDSAPLTTKGTPNRQDVPLFFGNTPGVGQENHKGLIDEVRIWDVARSAEDIRRTMNGPLNGNEPHLVGYWKFDEGEGQTVSDTSPNENHGYRGNDSAPDTWDPQWTSSTAPLSISGPRIRLSTYSLDFSMVEVVSSARRTVIEANLSAEDTLIVSNLALSRPEFTLDTTPDVIEIAPLESYLFTIIYTPDSAQTDTATFSMATNDSIHPFVEILLLGRAYALTPEPVITSIRDIPQDQGRQVRVQWFRSVYDGVVDSIQVVDYGVWRRVNGSGANGSDATSSKTISRQSETQVFFNNALWDFVATVRAVGFSEYAQVAPTLFDSTASNGIQWSVFMVTAHTSTGKVFFSQPDSGYSIDNIPPQPPTNPRASLANDAVVLEWDESPDPDVDHYAIYRGHTATFIPSESNRIGTSSDNTFVDNKISGSEAFYYIVTSIDVSGNESARSEVVSAIITAVHNDRARFPSRYKLFQNFPNPFNPSTTIRYALPVQSKVVLTVYDVRGTLIATLVDQIQSAGYYVNKWGQGFASGVYFLKIEARSVSCDGSMYQDTRKMLLVK
jgi:hypothetical protein